MTISGKTRPGAKVLVATSFTILSLSVSGAELQRIRVGKTTEQTRLVFDLSQSTPYRFFALENPGRLVVDFHQLEPTEIKPSLSLDDTGITGIRTGIQPDGTVRYVFDLKKSNTVARVFTLPPEGERGHRVVLDVENPTMDTPARTEQESIPSPENRVPSAETLHLASSESTGERREYSSRRRANRDATEGTWSGWASFDARLFPNSPAYPEQKSQNASIALRPEYYRQWDAGRQQFSFIYFGRLDSSDSERSHWDIPELFWQKQASGWSIKVGADVEFWGVAESQHLVNIINQTDLVENIDGEERLGQPMVNLNLARSWGNLDLYVMPWFRERTFPGPKGRLRPPIPVDTDNPIYESGQKEKHTDFALRWSNYIGDWDIGLAHFSGTGRDPLLVPYTDGGQTTLRPLYFQIDQTSLDVQATKGQWLWKLEALYNDNSLKDYFAYVGGFEYTKVGIGGGNSDLGLLLEYHYDQRGLQSFTNLENDIYLGMRWTANDLSSTSLLAGVLIDADSQATFGSIEASRRIGDNWILSVEARLFTNTANGDVMHFLREDDYLEIQVQYHY